MTPAGIVGHTQWIEVKLARFIYKKHNIFQNTDRVAILL